ncbi:hypothetical protein ABPG77_007525 [Micractinium sp. CCAP 211/92]
MKIKVTPTLRELLLEAASDGALPQELQAAASNGAAAGAADWDTIKAATEAARRRKGPEAVPPMELLCRGSGLVFPERPKQAGKPPELQRRLDELRARLEQQQYDRMVADVTHHERKAAERREGALVNYRQQIGFAVHILAMMAAFYAFGHVAGMALTSNRTLHPIIGLVFMASSLVLETVLFIIRTTVPPKLHREAAWRAVAARVAKQQERYLTEHGRGAEAGASSSGGGSSGPGGRVGAGGGGQDVAQQAAGARTAAKPAGEKKDD